MRSNLLMTTALAIGLAAPAAMAQQNQKAQPGQPPAADYLGINRNTLNKKVKDLGIEAGE